MGFRLRLPWETSPKQAAPVASVQQSGGGNIIVTPEQLEDAMRGGALSESGQVVTPETAMRVGGIYACIRLISGPPSILPMDVKRRLDYRTREDASNLRIWSVLRRKPNPWQTPVQFKRMLTAHVLLRGNGYAHIVRDYKNEVQQLIPLNPDRIQTKQRADLKLEYIYTNKAGNRVVFQQSDVLHLMNLTLDGVTGVTPITYARETIGSSLAMEAHGSNVFRNGAQVDGLLKSEKALGEVGRANVRAGLEEYRAQGEKAGKVMILEDGLDYMQMGLSGRDAQWIEARRFARSDIAMFYGVPPHMIGDTEKSTSWGTGLEQQTQGFTTFTLEEYFTMWEQGLALSCLPEDDESLYVRINRSALVKGDIKTRWNAYAIGRALKVYSANDIRAMEDQNPIDGGDVYENPNIDLTNSEDTNEPE